jgi:hypothetical protein
MNLPIDTSKVRFTAVSEPTLEVAITNNQSRLTARAGAAYVLRVLAVCEGFGAEIIKIKVHSELKDVRPELVVKITNLQLVPWTLDNRSGISYEADLIEAATGSATNSSRS